MQLEKKKQEREREKLKLSAMSRATRSILYITTILPKAQREALTHYQ